MISTAERPVVWHKSSYSTNGGNCLEMGLGCDGEVPVQDSKYSTGPILSFAPYAWNAFIVAVQGGSMDAAAQRAR